MKKCGSIYHTFSVYKGGVFMRSRIIKRRTVAKEACDKGIVTINGKVAKSSSEVNIGDLLEIQFGEKKMKFKINEIREHVLKNDAKEMYEIIE